MHNRARSWQSGTPDSKRTRPQPLPFDIRGDPGSFAAVVADDEQVQVRLRRR